MRRELEKSSRSQEKQQKIDKRREEKFPICQNCGKGHIQIVIINAGNIEKIITCDVCDHREIVRKDVK